MHTRTIVHVGPPKTGSSALQHWLLGNRRLLRDYGVFYPEHPLGASGISSGHVDTLYDRIGAGDFTFSSIKYAELIGSMAASGCHTLLLSSEFFFQVIDELHNELADAEFVYYLRSPQEVMESIYNQHVKRHSYTEVFHASEIALFSQLESLSAYLENFGSKRLNIRAYGENFFHGGNIGSDFLSLLGQNILCAGMPDRINTSYEFEALEIMRRLNHFPLGDMHGHIDAALQCFDRGIADYSLTPPEVYRANQLEVAGLIDEVFCRAGIESATRFLEAIRTSIQKPYYPQELTRVQFDVVARFLKEALGGGSEICSSIRDAENIAPLG
jgi:hypothetical protein